MEKKIRGEVKPTDVQSISLYFFSAWIELEMDTSLVQRKLNLVPLHLKGI